MKSLRDNLSGVLHFALSINLGGGFVRMHEIVLAVVAERAVITRVAVNVLDSKIATRLFESTPSVFPQKRLVFSRRNILRRDLVEVFVSAGVAVNETLVKNIVVESFADVFCRKSFAVTKRRWTDGDRLFDDFSLFNGFCGLATVCFKFFAVLSRVGRKPKCMQGPCFGSTWSRVLPSDCLE